MGILRYTFLIVLLLCSNSFGQLSPGDLSEPHEGLEGISNCTSCHELGEGPSATKCLECHKTLKNQIEQSKGYHYKIVAEEGKICFTCHSDHAGKDFELIRWDIDSNVIETIIRSSIRLSNRAVERWLTCNAWVCSSVIGPKDFELINSR